MKLCFYLFDDFETLDLFGPVEILCRVKDFEAEYYSKNGGFIRSAQGTVIKTFNIEDFNGNGIFVIPGGRGTRTLVCDFDELEIIKKACEKAEWVLSICTGSAVLAKCGVLDGRAATSNKKAFDWVCSCGENVKWERVPRFCKDGKFYTSAGVSAGMDMALEFVKDLFGNDLALRIAEDIEYDWNY